MSAGLVSRCLYCERQSIPPGSSLQLTKCHQIFSISVGCALFATGTLAQRNPLVGSNPIELNFHEFVSFADLDREDQLK
jgi:hypothetical protein